MNQKKPVAVITGGGTGIGAAVARKMAHGGYHVCVVGRRSEPLRAVAEELNGDWVSGDLSNSVGARAAVEQCLDKLGTLDSLVLNAAASIYGTPLDCREEDWDQIIGTNLTGAFFASQAALPALIEAKGSLVSVASVAAIRASTASVAYCSAKAGMVMMTQCIALEYGHTGLRANSVLPGWTRTDMADRSMDKLGAALGLDREGAYAAANAENPLRRPGTAEELANVVAWVASPEASYVNAAAIVVDGGATMVDPNFVAFPK
jgi:meso-butanediol dehydrogenase/(S,S)-butanediol dehydrogenase/diacetyl reductase